MTTLLVAAGTAAAMSALGGWCGGGDGDHADGHAYAKAPAAVAMAPAAPNVSAAANHVTIAGFAFAPSTLTISRGTTVTWTNDDSAPHTVTSSASGPLHSSTLHRGDTYSYTFNSTGTFGYYCMIHPDMHGTVVVK
ncbi:plastocyanin [Streptomyces olivoverticillatus]|uniref:Plastocyanin n=1 Tax=Streptomyces olivoverticillatus TaxID=66427 RepID=A0A7W7PPH9_9ACTN|nr:plastocyanin [Streptomyces olivoverticillatus]